MPIFDTHAHYDSGGFNADRDEVLSALPGSGVGLVVDPGCDVESSRRAVALAEKYSVLDMFLGKTGGSLGEVSALLLLIGGVYLIWRKVIN